MRGRTRTAVIAVAAVSGVVATVSLVLAILEAARGHDPTHALFTAVVVGAVCVAAAASADGPRR